MKKYSNINLFNQNLNNKYKLIPFNIKKNDSGEIKYLPPVSKEWKNTVYSYNKNDIKNMPINDKNINKIIQNYFNLYFKNNKFIGSKYISRKSRPWLLKRTYVSNVEIKHTNNKAIITLYTLNLEKNNLYENYISYSNIYMNNILKYWRLKLKDKINNEKVNNIVNKDLINLKKKELILFKYKLINKQLKSYNLYLKLFLSRTIKHLYSKKLKTLRRYQLMYYLNKHKFEKTTLLFKLNTLISGILNKKVEFNIINLKSVAFNSDILTKALSLKIRKNCSPIVGMDMILNKTSLPIINRVLEKSKTDKNKKLFENNYKDLSLIHNLSEGNVNFDELLKDIHPMNESNLTKYNIQNSKKVLYNKISKDIFNSIKYKNIGGLKLEAKGRLTRRYRADRAVYKFKVKGGLKNIDSSYKGLSTVVYRGLYKPNITNSISSSKRYVGAFAVKGWISGK